MRAGATFYTRHGDVFAFGCIALSAIALAWPAVRAAQRRRGKQASRPDATPVAKILVRTSRPPRPHSSKMQ